MNLTRVYSQEKKKKKKYKKNTGIKKYHISPKEALFNYVLKTLQN